ncbi:hypothetical protein BC835DRAFT_458571 [Cytidiella melzeri]|nr:hypothetical protein BC835DRAFT_458571 [Cytidiella melzeri]
MAQGLLALSVELIVEILSYLNHHNLLKCRQLSKKIHAIILNTSFLQYRIELGLTGNQDGRSSDRSVSERLKALRRVQREWERPKPTLVDTLVIPSRDWSQSKWQKDVFFGKHPTNNRQLDMFNFGASFAGKERLQHLSFDMDFDTFSVDFDQDLIALARCSETDQQGRRVPPRVYLRSLRDQKPHPKAQRTSFELGPYGFLGVDYILRARLQIAGKYLMLTLYRSLPVEAILVWHWPTGFLNAFFSFTHRDGCINAMCTDTGHLLLAKRPESRIGWFGIYVFTLRREDDLPGLLAMFELPKLAVDVTGWITASFFPREHTCGVLTGGLAYTATNFNPSSVLVQFQWDRQYTLYTPLVTFLSQEVLNAGRRTQPLDFSWDSWGPHSSRVFQEGSAGSIICGYRAIFPDYILDFSPATLRNVDVVSGAAVQAKPHALEVSSMFAYPVITSLPYCKISLALPPTPSTVDARSQMHMAFVDVDGPKLLRVTCADFILIPSSVEIFSLREDGDTIRRPTAASPASEHP